MLHALTAPLLTSVVLGGIALGVAATQVATEPESTTTTRRLSLHAIAQPDAIYLSAWDKGDLVLTSADASMRPLTFTTRAWLADNCRWQGTETLTPIDGHSYAYDYTEQKLECRPGCQSRIRIVETPRKGLVTVRTY